MTPESSVDLLCTCTARLRLSGSPAAVRYAASAFTVLHSSGKCRVERLDEQYEYPPQQPATTVLR